MPDSDFNYHLVSSDDLPDDHQALLMAVQITEARRQSNSTQSVLDLIRQVVTINQTHDGDMVSLVLVMMEASAILASSDSDERIRDFIESGGMDLVESKIIGKH